MSPALARRVLPLFAATCVSVFMLGFIAGAMIGAP